MAFLLDFAVPCQFSECLKIWLHFCYSKIYMHSVIASKCTHAAIFILVLKYIYHNHTELFEFCFFIFCVWFMVHVKFHAEKEVQIANVLYCEYDRSSTLLNPEKLSYVIMSLKNSNCCGPYFYKSRSNRPYAPYTPLSWHQVKSI